MKKLIYILVIFLLLFASSWQLKGQNDYPYIPFADNGEWAVNNIKYTTSGDTLIAGKSYLKMYNLEMNQTNYFCAIRNDTVNKKVYGIYHEATTVYAPDEYGSAEAVFNTTDTMELLLYDFSLQFGDTIIYYLFSEYTNGMKIFQLKATRVWECSILAGYQDYSYISKNYFGGDSLISMENGSLRKKILISSQNISHAEGQFWIEGVGSSSGVVVTWYDYLAVPLDFTYTRLLCYSQNNELLYHTEFDISDNDSTDCYSHGFGGGIEENRLIQYVKIYPNPAENILHILFNNALTESAQIEIYDITGRCVQSEKLANSFSTVNISSLRSGIYFYRIIYQGSVVARDKVVKQ